MLELAKSRRSPNHLDLVSHSSGRTTNLPFEADLLYNKPRCEEKDSEDIGDLLIVYMLAIIRNRLKFIYPFGV